MKLQIKLLDEKSASFHDLQISTAKQVRSEKKVTGTKKEKSKVYISSKNPQQNN